MIGPKRKTLALVNPEPKKTGPLSMRQLRDLHLAQGRARGNDTNTLSKEELYISRALEFWGEDFDARTLRTIDLERYREWLGAQVPMSGHRNTLAPSTIALHLASLRAACTRAVRAGLLETNPVVDLERRPASQGTLTLGELGELWLTHAKSKGRPTRSIRHDQKNLQRAYDFFGTSKQASDLRVGDVERYREWLASEKPRTRGGKALLPATVNLHMGVLRAAFNRAMKLDLLTKNPVALVPPMRVNNERDRLPTPEEHRQLLEAASAQMKLAITLAAETGMRQANIAGLRWSQIDLDARTITISADETKQNKKLVVPLSRAAEAALRAYPIDPIFTLTARKISEQFGQLTKALNIKGLVFHDYRHLWATTARRSGLDILTIMRMLGHSSLRTAKRYQTIDTKDLVNAVDQKTAIHTETARVPASTPHPSGGARGLALIAAELGFTVEELEAEIAAGKLKARTLRGQTLVLNSDLDAWLAGLATI